MPNRCGISEVCALQAELQFFCGSAFPRLFVSLAASANFSPPGAFLDSSAICNKCWKWYRHRLMQPIYHGIGSSDLILMVGRLDPIPCEDTDLEPDQNEANRGNYRKRRILWQATRSKTDRRLALHVLLVHTRARSSIGSGRLLVSRSCS